MLVHYADAFLAWQILSYYKKVMIPKKKNAICISHDLHLQRSNMHRT